jgi:hypothetical protein
MPYIDIRRKHGYKNWCGKWPVLQQAGSLSMSLSYVWCVCQLCMVLCAGSNVTIETYQDINLQVNTYAFFIKKIKNWHEMP